jgi:hypothetical protein
VIVNVAVDGLAPTAAALEQLGNVPFTLPIAAAELHVGTFGVLVQLDQPPGLALLAPVKLLDQPPGLLVPSI